MSSLKTDVDRLDEALISLFQHLKRPANWAEITATAGVILDRPSSGIVHILCNKGARFTLNDLAEKLGVEAPTVTRKTQQLEKQGLVRRSKSTDDRRSVYLEVTDKGRNINRQIRLARRKLSEKALKQWTIEDRSKFIDLFEKYVDSLKP
ncbi:MAG TPA: MarR family transcriptional regulator [Candidatus Saccharimonadales bacterium]